jgi:hypothetical protein
MGTIAKWYFATWRGIFCPSKGGAILGSTGYRKTVLFLLSAILVSTVWPVGYQDTAKSEGVLFFSCLICLKF